MLTTLSIFNAQMNGREQRKNKNVNEMMTYNRNDYRKRHTLTQDMFHSDQAQIIEYICWLKKTTTTNP